MANITNIVGQKTLDYINNNKTMKQLTSKTETETVPKTEITNFSLCKQQQNYINKNKTKTENKTMKQLTLNTKTETAETTAETKTAKTVSRKINGTVKKLTPTENFIHAADKRLQYLDYQFELLGKMNGSQFERTTEMIDVIETEILEMASKALDSLRNPSIVKQSKKSFAAKLRKA